MDPFTVMLRVAEAMFWTAAAIVGLIYRLCRMLFFFWRKHHRSRLALPLSARFEHTHIVGGSGHGKTQLLQQLILYDLERVNAAHPSQDAIFDKSRRGLFEISTSRRGRCAGFARAGRDAIR